MEKEAPDMEIKWAALSTCLLGLKANEVTLVSRSREDKVCVGGRANANLCLLSVPTIQYLCFIIIFICFTVESAD